MSSRPVPKASGWNRLTFWGAAAAAAGLVLGCVPRDETNFGLPKLAFLAAGVWTAWLGVCGESWSERVRSRRTAFDLPLAFCAAALLLSTVFSRDVYLSFMGYYNSYFCGALPLLLCAALFYAVVRDGGAENRAALFRALLVSGVLCAAYGIAERLGAVKSYMPEGRIESTMGGPVFLGSVLLALVAPALSFASTGGRRDRVLGFFFLLTGGVALILTRSRGSFLGAAAAAAAYVMLRGRLRLRFGKIAAAALVCAVAVAGISFFRAGTVRVDAERLQLWASGLKAFTKHPWTGTGPDTFQLALRQYKTDGFLRTVKRTDQGQFDAHNLFVQALATTGLAGFLSLLGLLAALVGALREAHADPSRRELAAALGGAFAGLFLYAQFDPTPLAGVGLAAVFAGMLAAEAPPRVNGGTSSRLIAASVLALLSGAALFVGRQFAADRHQRRAVELARAGRSEEALADFSEAARLAPRQIQYRLPFVSYLCLLAQDDGPRRGELLARAAEVGREAVFLNPFEVDAYQAYAVALARLGADRLAEAERALDRAQELDPSFLAVMKSRLWLASARKEDEKFRSVSAELTSVRELIKDAGGKTSE